MIQEIIEKEINNDNVIVVTADKSKKILPTNSIFLDSALDINEEVCKNITEKFNDQKTYFTIKDSLQHLLDTSVDLSENTVDTIINSYYRQMEVTADFNTRLVNAVKKLNSDNQEKMLSLIQHDFEISWKATVENTKRVIESYNKHANMRHEITKQFAEITETHITYTPHMQSKESHSFNEWLSEWWKQP